MKPRGLLSLGGFGLGAVIVTVAISSSTTTFANNADQNQSVPESHRYMVLQEPQALQVPQVRPVPRVFRGCHGPGVQPAPQRPERCGG